MDLRPRYTFLPTLYHPPSRSLSFSWSTPSERQKGLAARKLSGVGERLRMTEGSMTGTGRGCPDSCCPSTMMPSCLICFSLIIFAVSGRSKLNKVVFCLVSSPPLPCAPSPSAGVPPRYDVQKLEVPQALQHSTKRRDHRGCVEERKEPRDSSSQGGMLG